MEILSFNKFVFILALGAARRLEVESKLGLLGDLQPGLNSQNFMSKSHISTEGSVAEVIPTAFFLVQVVVFRLPATFNSHLVVAHNPEFPALIHENPEVPDALIQNLAHFPSIDDLLVGQPLSQLTVNRKLVWDAARTTSNSSNTLLL